MYNLTDKVAVVTGGSSGIGRAIAFRDFRARLRIGKLMKGIKEVKFNPRAEIAGI